MNGEKSPKIEVVSSEFDAYAREQIARFNGLSDFLTDSLPLVENLETCNATLTEAGRPDLAITERAEVMPIETPQDVMEKCSNFTAGFYMYSDKIITAGDNFESETYVPFTTDEVSALKNLPTITNYKQLEEATGGDITLPRDAYLTHIVRPAFVRMLVLFPDFTVDLVTRLSGENRQHKTRLEPELYVSYQLMSRLVDTNDVHEGSPDSWYLCH